MEVNIVNGRRENQFSKNPKILIDIYRSTTTMPLMLKKGASKIIPVSSVSVAKKMKNEYPDYIIAGERYGFKVPGFQMSNSPYEVMNTDLDGKTIIFTSTNGTKVLNKIKDSEVIFICSYANVFATLPFLKNFSVIEAVLSGRPDGYADEDYYFGMFVKTYLETGKDQFDYYIEQTRKGQGTKRLSMIGGKKDVELCLQRDLVPFPVIFQNGEIIRKPQE
ncbi:MAG: 2-phosphosulfolactate phosphatase [Candidatus Thermoplasmatota archaeon]|nr:2-phosphosulfolactate phosphatase [Candidatus Thermoplasmatota archaeon]